MRMKPDSRALGRGALGGVIDGRSREGRFVRRIEAELIQQLGGVPSFGQLLLVRRAARAALKLELYDQKLASAGLTDHDSRMYGGLSNNLRLLLRELGLKHLPPIERRAFATSLPNMLAEDRCERRNLDPEGDRRSPPLRLRVQGHRDVAGLASLSGGPFRHRAVPVLIRPTRFAPVRPALPFLKALSRRRGSCAAVAAAKASSWRSSRSSSPVSETIGLISAPARRRRSW
jgi:hypothetical protein